MAMPNLSVPSALSIAEPCADEAMWKAHSPVVNSAVDLPSRPP